MQMSSWPVWPGWLWPSVARSSSSASPSAERCRWSGRVSCRRRREMVIDLADGWVLVGGVDPWRLVEWGANEKMRALVWSHTEKCQQNGVGRQRVALRKAGVRWYACSDRPNRICSAVWCGDESSDNRSVAVATTRTNHDQSHSRYTHAGGGARTAQTIKLAWRAGHFTHCNEMIASSYF